MYRCIKSLSWSIESHIMSMKSHSSGIKSHITTSLIPKYRSVEGVYSSYSFYIIDNYNSKFSIELKHKKQYLGFYQRI
jgi:hypothetical protein